MVYLFDDELCYEQVLSRDEYFRVMGKVWILGRSFRSFRSPYRFNCRLAHRFIRP